MTLSVTQLNVGWFTAAAGLWRRGEPMDTMTRFPIPAYLIETDDERILVDAGLHPHAVSDAASHYDGAPSLAAQLWMSHQIFSPPSSGTSAAPVGEITPFTQKNQSYGCPSRSLSSRPSIDLT